MKDDLGNILKLRKIYQFNDLGPVYLILSSVSINILGLSLPILLMQVYDRIIAQEGVNTLLWLIAGSTVAIILESILRVLRFNLASWIVSQYEYETGNIIFRSIFNNSLFVTRNFNVGEIIDVMRFPSKVRKLYSGQIFQVLMDLPFSFIFVGVIYYLNSLIGIYLLVLNISYIVIIRLTLKKLNELKDDRENFESGKASFLIEIISKIQVLKSLGIGENIMRRNEYLQDRSLRNEAVFNNINSFPQMITSFFTQLNLFGTIIIGAINVINNEITIGILTACTILGGRSFRPLVGLFNFWNGLYDLDIAADKVAKLVKYSKTSDNEEFSDLPDSIEGRIVLKDLSFSYTDDNVLDQVNIEINPKEILAIKGKDKVGATTLAQLIMGNLTPDSGSILIDNYSVGKFSSGSVSKVISYVSDKDTIYRGSVLDNITLFKPHLSDIGLDCAAIVDLDDIVSELPYGYNTIVDSNLSKSLPGDLTIRIMLARAILKRPKVLILDKADSMLDSKGEDMFYWLLKRLKSIMTIVLVTTNNRYHDHADIECEIISGKCITNYKEKALA